MDDWICKRCANEFFVTHKHPLPSFDLFKRGGYKVFDHGENWKESGLAQRYTWETYGIHHFFERRRGLLETYINKSVIA